MSLMQWLPLAWEFVTNLGLALGLDRVSTIRPWWLRLAVIAAGLSISLIVAYGLMLAGAFTLGLASAMTR